MEDYAEILRDEITCLKRSGGDPSRLARLEEDLRRLESSKAHGF